VSCPVLEEPAENPGVTPTMLQQHFKPLQIMPWFFLSLSHWFLFQMYPLLVMFFIDLFLFVLLISIYFLNILLFIFNPAKFLYFWSALF